ncbi:MAG: peroxiredoxin [Candidatus Nitrosocaldaceae archaeon]
MVKEGVKKTSKEKKTVRSSIKIGSKAPDFKLVDQDLKMHSIKDHKGRKVVLAFFPAAMSPVCTREMCAFRDSFAELQNAGADVVAISVDGPFANKQFVEMHHLNFPVLSDYDRKVVKKYNVLMPNLLNLKGYNAAKRAVFLIDEKGIIRYRWLSNDPSVEPNYEEIKNAIHAK